jgi:hypothetical protein
VVTGWPQVGQPSYVHDPDGNNIEAVTHRPE